MKKETFDDAMKWLNKYHGRSLSDFAVDVYWKEFEDVDEEIFCRGVVKSYEVFPPGRFPTISDLRGLLIEFRESDWRKEKQAPLRVERSKMGKEALALVSSLWISEKHSKKISSYQLAAMMMMEMEEKYPGYGWAANGRILLNWLERHEKNKEKKEVIRENTEPTDSTSENSR